jgi:hypothetical protein
MLNTIIDIVNKNNSFLQQKLTYGRNIIDFKAYLACFGQKNETLLIRHPVQMPMLQLLTSVGLRHKGLFPMLLPGKSGKLRNAV